MKMYIALSGLASAFAAVVLLAGCNPPDSGTAAPATSGTAATTTEPAKPAFPAQPPFSLQALAPSVVVSVGPPAKLSLTTGSVMLVYPSTMVIPGDTVKFEFTVSGTDQGQLRTVLMRHCGDGPESDSASEVFELTSAPEVHVVEHKFTSAHPCLRVMFGTPVGKPVDVTLDKWQLMVPEHPVVPATAPAPAPKAAATLPTPAPKPKPKPKATDPASNLAPEPAATITATPPATQPN